MTSLLAIQPGLLCRPALRFSGARRIELFGVPLDRVGLEQAAARLLGWIREGRGPHLVATPDTPTLMRAGRNPALQNVYRQASLVTADGTGILWAARLLGARLPQRVTGIDLIETVCRQASVAFNRGDFRRCRLFLLGARPGVAAEAAARLGKRYPGVQIVGTCHGYFRAAETEALLQEIRGTAPDILLVGLGVPRQELWMVAHRDQLSTPVLIGVGGSFDVLSGRLCRAPRSWQKLGLEWLYRLIAQPRRLLRLWPLPLFLGRLLLGLLRMLL
ncbi:MAG TPA: glycosyltransferase [Candidatus Fraserbacteria bacterium]|nr:glycosyltransferase [Candidatus Fraserbacteria bacterium]